MKIFDYMQPFDIDGMTKKRIGRNTDGGYIIPNELIPKLDFCLSYGVADDVSFECDLARQNDKIKFAFYDPTIQQMPECGIMSRSTFTKKWISPYTEGDNITPHDTMPDDVSSVLLKCDIEGSEYGSIQTLTDDVRKIACIIIEVHDVSSNIEKCTDLLRFINNEFTLFHVHANTCGGYYITEDAAGRKIKTPTVYELTYVNNFYVTNKKPYTGRLPIDGLDFQNNPGIPDADISFLTNNFY